MRSPSGYPRVYSRTGRDMQARHAGMGYHRTGMGMSRLDALLDLLVGPIPSRWCRVFPVDGAVSAQPFACLRAGNTQLGSAAADQKHHGQRLSPDRGATARLLCRRYPPLRRQALLAQRLSDESRELPRPA